MPVKSPEIVEVEKVPDLNPVGVSTPESVANVDEPKTVIIDKTEDVLPADVEKVPEPTSLPQIKVSALSLASIRAKKELAESNKANIKEDVHLPTEAFNETDMLLQWTKYAQRLSDRGHKIMESLLLINDPKLQGTTIIHELPNEGSKIDFESEKHELVGYLRGKLHNHDIEIKIIVNESMDSRKAFTPQDRFNRLNEINPSLELLRKTFDLDI
jgi:hypothetical protein